MMSIPQQLVPSLSCPRRSVWPAVCGLAALLLTAPLRAAGMEITEIMGDNLAFLADEDGNHPDWIELYNSSTTDVNLAGWRLTDRLDEFDLWEFPERILAPGEFLLVFASGKDRRQPAGPLHTNFRIERDGEPVSLVRPDGTVAAQYQARVLVDDTSFGIVMDKDSALALPAGAPVKYFVPADDSLGLDWTSPDFDDGTWASGTTGIGYDQKRNPTYTDLIATDIADVMRRVNPSVYLRLPFTLDDPSAFRSLLLRLKYEDGFVAYLNGTPVASSNARDPLEWDSRSAARRAEAVAVRFQFFGLSGHLGLLRPGTNVLAIHGLNDSTSSSDYLMLPQLEAVRSVSLSEDRRYFREPTPGWENSADGVPGVVLRPRFSHEGGVHAETFLLELSVVPPEAEIHYTLNGTVPTEGSPLYTEPIPIQRSTVVIARAFHPDFLPSPVVMQNYILVDGSVAGVESEVPIVLIDTLGRPVPPRESIIRGPSNIAIYEPGMDGPTTLEAPTHVGYGGIRIRGSSSSGFPKKMFSFETWDERADDEDVPLLGLPAESDWVLYGPYSDKTLMRNVLSYGWSNAIGRYAPRTKFFELYLNSTAGRLRTAHYVGVYVLIEKIKHGEHRVDIAKLYPSQDSEPEITGGYILKFDRADLHGGSSFRTDRGRTIQFDAPKLVSAAQRAYIKGYVDAFEAALFSPDFSDPEAGYLLSPRFCDSVFPRLFDRDFGAVTGVRWSLG